jgi:hypothetical protein
MPPVSLQGFVRCVMADQALQVRLRRCKFVDDIIALAAECGYTLSYLDLRLGIAYPEVECSHWPWSGLGSQARRLFFLRSRDGAH